MPAGEIGDEIGFSFVRVAGPMGFFVSGYEGERDPGKLAVNMDLGKERAVNP